jgi:hypothetical protein
MDPISTAVGLSKAAKSIGESSLLKTLLGPVAAVQGEHWAEARREALGRAKTAKANANRAAHVSAVAAILEDQHFDADPALAEAWLDDAGAIDPVDEDLSAAWRAVFLAIGEGDVHRQRLLEVVKEMKPDEARAFIRLADRRPSIQVESDYRKRLESLGLVRSYFDLLVSGRVVFAALVSVLFAGLVTAVPFGYVFLVQDRSPTMATAIASAQQFLWISVAIWGCTALFMTAHQFRRPALTELGRALFRLTSKIAAKSMPSIKA